MLIEVWQCALVSPVGSALVGDVLTIEGLEKDGQLHPLQQAFLDNGAFQCGFCTPGMIMSSLGLLNSCPSPSKEQIIAGLQGSICRCGFTSTSVLFVLYSRLARLSRRQKTKMRRRPQYGTNIQANKLRGSDQSGGGPRRPARQFADEAGATAIGDWLCFCRDGMVEVMSGKAEVGQSIRTSLAQAVAEELRLPFERVRVLLGDTDFTPYDMGTFGSRTTPVMADRLHKVAASARGIDHK